MVRTFGLGLFLAEFDYFVLDRRIWELGRSGQDGLSLG